jgi:hypothetical protein
MTEKKYNTAHLLRKKRASVGYGAMHVIRLHKIIQKHQTTFRIPEENKDLIVNEKRGIYALKLPNSSTKTANKRFSLQKIFHKEI